MKSAQTGLISYLTDDKAYLKHIKWENSTKRNLLFAITTLLFMLSACQNTAEPEQTASVAKIDTVSVTESAAETESTPAKGSEGNSAVHHTVILSYDKELCVYIGIAFMPDTVGREQAEEIAQTVKFGR